MMAQAMRSISFCLLLLLVPALAVAETLSGRVVRLVDTVYVLDAAHEQHKIRLAGIDAPERKQPFGKKAKDHLAGLVSGRDALVEWNKHDRYGRIVGKIVFDGQDVDLDMVRDGYAWWYRKYAGEQNAGDRVLYEAAEDQAKVERRGLWIDPDPVPPWEWRKRQRGDR
jgi:micrococcal nuclease